MDDQMAMSFESDDSLAGFRLARVEVYNWGTFNKKIWTLVPDGKNTLLTGDIGSGKSTLVDAITTLLVPANRISYNKAAGADTKERTLRSYVMGYYKTERSEGGFGAKPVALRDNANYSVILGVFKNCGFLQTVTLAQVFQQRDLVGQPNRFFVIAEGELSIAEHFADFGSDIRNLKKRLKLTTAINDVYDNFPPYASSFRRRFGIENDQAMDLFHQTVSMKSVGNLTDFVRSHMLEAFDIESRIDALITHFDDLNRAHDFVVKAKMQIRKLQPMIKDLDKHALNLKQRSEYRYLRDGLRWYFAKIQYGLFQKRLQKLTDKHNELSCKINQLKEILLLQHADRDRLKTAISQNGGDRLERLKADIVDLDQKRSTKFEKAQNYRNAAEHAGIPDAATVELFFENQQIIKDKLNSFQTFESDLQNIRTEKEVELKTSRDNYGVIAEEIKSLEKRRSNISSKQVIMRLDLCKTLGIKEEDIPFAGELMQVRNEDAVWEGAIERILHNFSLSLLVPEKLYSDVSEWVNKTDLKGRMVYYKVKLMFPVEKSEPHPDSMIHKVCIRPESRFYGWIERELRKRFDYACCKEMKQFRREKQAVTVLGQIKSAGYRHEKDDRHKINDRSRYVLGWSNEQKLDVLKRKKGELEKSIQAIMAAISKIQEETNCLSALKTQFIKLDSFTRFEDIDWKPVVVRINELEKELKDLENASDKLKVLNSQYDELEVEIKESERKIEGENHNRSKNEAYQEQIRSSLKQCEEMFCEFTPDNPVLLTDLLDKIRKELQGETEFAVDKIDRFQQVMRDYIQKKIDNRSKQIDVLKERVVRAMQDYCRDYPSETSEVDASVEAGPEYQKMLEQLNADDLPKFEKRFKSLLNENTIREIANFQSQLNRERQEIKERIDVINQSLNSIEYNKGRYILLEAQECADTEIRDFRQLLRACTEGSLTGSEEEQYAERKYLLVKDIVDRFRGREGTADMDKRWTKKVTDVRNWFSFAASERWMEDNTEYEHYTDSGGKSGGQKEKLAYTVLAASLAYQFGLEWGETSSRSFRFVVIDEAFGRGSDESARFGLELFKKLNLQLLIVTPLQKIHIIEPFVSSVGFVYNPDGRESLLRNLTIEEYITEKKSKLS